MLYSTQTFDALIRRINKIHAFHPFNFGISLGDCCNSTSYIEMKWYLDVLSGGMIRPSTGAHLGETGPNMVEY
jgi:hypothetical protein